MSGLILPGAQVLEIISPADPDNLQHLGNGIYYASWSPVNPHAVDVENLRHTPRVRIVKEPFWPEQLPDGWIAVHFTLGSEDE